MTTGEMPPGAKTGGAFIHDPKVNLNSMRKIYFEIFAFINLLLEMVHCKLLRPHFFV